MFVPPTPEETSFYHKVGTPRQLCAPAHIRTLLCWNLSLCQNDMFYHENMPDLEQRTLKNVNNCLNTNIYSYLGTSGGKSYNLYLNVVHFFQHQS